MKGLIIKDLMCLRKQRIVFYYVVAATIVLSVMFVLSTRFGNLHNANQMLMTENGFSGMDVNNILTMALIFFMLLPIALVGDISTVFVADGKAGFHNISAIFPISIEKRVMAKYITVLSMFSMSVAVDLIISFILSMITDIISFADFFGIIISAASLTSIYGAFTIFFCFLLGFGKESYAQILSLLSMFAIFVLTNCSKIRKYILGISADNAPDDLTLISDFMSFLKHKFYILLAIAVMIIIASYFGALCIAKRRRDSI